jgi:hypothetical protein
MILHGLVTLDFSFLHTPHGELLSSSWPHSACQHQTPSARTKKPAARAGSLHPLHSFAALSALPALSPATRFLPAGLAPLLPLPQLPHSISK